MKDYKINIEGNESQYILVKWNACWADEFDVVGFSIMTISTFKSKLKENIEVLERYFEKHKAKSKAAKNTYQYICYEKYFGTNQFLQFYSVEGYLHYFSFNYITENEYKTLEKLFNLEKSYIKTYGVGHYIFDLED